MIRRRLSSEQREERMPVLVAYLPLLWMLVGTLLYAPLGMYLFDYGPGYVLERTYFLLAGAWTVIFVGRIIS